MTVAEARLKPSGFADRVSAKIGASSIVTDADTIEYYSNDVYRTGSTPGLIVRPADDASLIELVALAYADGRAIVIRGGGASYTDGYLVEDDNSVLIDSSLLKRIDVDEANGCVTVGAGVTWAELKDKLDPLGWRTPFWGPFSGLAATIAGSISQNSISHGSGAFGISAESVLSVEVATANGQIVRTGSASVGAAPACRHYGPDLTGLFTGDCGTLGVKVSITLPMIRKREHFQALSYSFPNFMALHAGMKVIAQERLDDEHFAVDAALSQGQIAKEERAGRKAKMAMSVLKSSKSFTKGLSQLTKMGIAGDRALKNAEYACHYIIDGSSQAEAAAKTKRIQKLLSELGDEIPNSVPTVVQSMPFAPLFNVLGPAGERWAPLHGVFSHDDALAFHIAYDEFLEERQSEMERLGIWVGAMFECVGSSAFLYEIAIYWPDARTAYHDTVVDDDYLKGLPTHPENLEAREYVAALRRDMIELYAEHNSSHFQIGKSYPYVDRLSSGPQSLIKAVKSELDPKGLFNPGALGF